MTQLEGQHQAARPHLLIVDDDSDILMLLKQILLHDYHVTTASNGRQALQLMNQQAFDLVLLDIMMPDMNGLEVLAIIRSNTPAEFLPVVLVSALTHSQDIVVGLESGANDYITKPFDPEVVRARVKGQITLKKRVDERSETLTNLQTRYEFKDRFLNIATHDLKSPLNSIRLAHYYLRSILGDNPEVIEALDTIETTVNTMNELVEDYLDSSAIQMGKADIRLERVIVEDSLWDVISRYSATASQKNITLLIGDSEGEALADYSRLTQIIGNLVSNAIKYSPFNRVVTVASQIIDGAIRISVTDEGPGIPESERHTLFEPFSKLSPRPTGGESSTGLGLWIVKELVTLQNGVVGVDFPDVGGSCFWIDLPCYSESTN